MRIIKEPQFSVSGEAFVATMSERVLLLDGAMGTMIQQFPQMQEHLQGTVFASWPKSLAGCNDLYCLVRPDVIKRIHRDYLDAGADIITTNSFNSNSFSLSDYGLEQYVGKLNKAAAELARQTVDEYIAENPGRQCWVAGSVGPTGKSLTMILGEGSSDGSVLPWDELELTYTEQISALISGGADIILIETVFDTLNAKCALFAAEKVMTEIGRRLPVIVSVTLTESGRTLSGQTLDAFVATIAPFEPTVLGLNCGFGAAAMAAYVAELQKFPFAVSVYPNAGLPNALGNYDETPKSMADQLRPMLEAGMLNIVGGCCGTTPEHIRAIAMVAAEGRPRQIPEVEAEMVLAGLEPKEVSAATGFVNVGERCNVAGSRKFLRLIKENAMGEAIGIARSQVESGAQIIDVNMDDALLDSRAEMVKFIGLTGVDPDVARVPLMIDSSDWPTIVGALKCVQGRPIVNSISLKEGEEAFIEHGRFIRRMGAAVVIMAFDENGQADTFERRTEVAARAYRLLTEQAGFRGCDIVIDPNVLAVATGIEEHNSYAADFLRAIEWIKQNLPGAKVSGGISNLSFAFRGNNRLRESMHSVFLFHAIKRGMDMAIVNAAQLFNPDELEVKLREALEAVILNTSAEAPERLIELAPEFSNVTTQQVDKVVDETLVSPSKKLENAVIKGVTEGLDKMLAEVLAESESALSVIEGPLMSGMTRVGVLFGDGKMFLPQVVKSARTMHAAVEWLTPYIDSEKEKNGAARDRHSMVLATVKGDVHDIGKNIVSVVMNCNGIDVTDLGVMVPAETIVDTAQRIGADYVGLSGLITPSLEEMCAVARLMQQRGLTIPLLIGGATTSELHTAVKIAECYDGPVVYTRDAAALPAVVQKLSDTVTRPAELQRIADRQQMLRDEFNAENEGKMLPYAEAKARAATFADDSQLPAKTGVTDVEIPLSDLRPLINWKAFVAAWGLEASLGDYAKMSDCQHCRLTWLAGLPEEKQEQGKQAAELIDAAKKILDELCFKGEPSGIKARVAIYPAEVVGDDVNIQSPQPVSIPMLRQQSVVSGKNTLSLADYIGKYVAVFAVTAGSGLESRAEESRKAGNEYDALVCQALSHRLAEAATEWVHRYVATKLWGYAKENEAVRGIRPAVGYPSLPDQSIVHLLDRLLHYGELGVAVTEHGALSPSATTTGFIIPLAESRYFSVGKIGADQFADYAARRGFSAEQMATFLPR